MSQEDVRRLLLSAGGEATVEELSELARERYPKRSLHGYLGERLKSLEKKEMVEWLDTGEGLWRLTEKGYENRAGEFNIGEIDSLISQEDLSQKGIKVVNMMGSLNLESPIDLETQASRIPEAEYHPETSPGLIYRTQSNTNSNKLTILAHSTGWLSITGAKYKTDLVECATQFLSSIHDLDIHIESYQNKIGIQNVVAKADIGRELDLAEVAIALNLENIEYDPESFHGLIYRSKENPTVLIFKSGKVVITGAKTFVQILDAYNEMIQNLVKIGVNLD